MNRIILAVETDEEGPLRVVSMRTVREYTSFTEATVELEEMTSFYPKES